MRLLATLSLVGAVAAWGTKCLPSGDEVAINDAFEKGEFILACSKLTKPRWKGDNSDTMPGICTSPVIAYPTKSTAADSDDFEWRNWPGSCNVDCRRRDDGYGDLVST